MILLLVAMVMTLVKWQWWCRSLEGGGGVEDVLKGVVVVWRKS